MKMPAWSQEELLRANLAPLGSRWWLGGVQTQLPSGTGWCQIGAPVVPVQYRLVSFRGGWVVHTLNRLARGAWVVLELVPLVR